MIFQQANSWVAQGVALLTKTALAINSQSKKYKYIVNQIK